LQCVSAFNTQRLLEDMNIHLLSSKPVACRQMGLTFDIWYIKSCSVDCPTHEPNPHGTRPLSTSTIKTLSIILFAWILTCTQPGGDTLIHGDSLGAWPLPSKVFLPWSEYLIASLHWPTMILPSVWMQVVWLPQWSCRQCSQWMAPFWRGTSNLSSLWQQPRNIAICVEVNNDWYSLEEDKTH